jgi:hypothetical protein
MLGGLVAAGIPVLIHLLLKTKQRKMRFSTLRFFDFLDQESVRSRKLRHWLLLLLRLILLVLLVLVFARPFLGDRAGAAAGHRTPQVVFLLDRSLSMEARDPEGVRWERARAAIRKSLSSLPREARVALIACGGTAEFLAEPGPAAEALKALEAAKQTPSAGELGDGFQLAARLFASDGARYSNTLCVVSDLQRASSRKVGNFPLPPEVAVEVVNVGDALAPNVAVTEMQLATASGQTSAVMVANFSDEDAGPFQARLLVDGKEAQAREIQVRGAAVTNVDFSLPRLTPGWHGAEVRVESKDALAADNVRFQAIYAPPPLPVLVVEPRRGVKVYQEESFFVVSALDPWFGLTNATGAGFAVEKAGPDDLARKLAVTGGKYPYELVVVPGLKQWPAGAAAALQAYVQAGGGLLLFLGDGVSANHYQTELGPLLPTRLGAMETAKDMDWRLWEFERRSPVFAPFRLPNSGNLAVARFTQRSALELQEGDQVLARFQDGVPAMVARTVGRGRVVLMNSSADAAWNDWPKHKTFVPWLHCAARFLAGRAAETEAARPAPLFCGMDTSLALGPEYKLGALRLVRPDGTEARVVADDQGAVHDLDLAMPGVYSLRQVQGAEVRRLAVNVPSSESDLAAFTAAEFQSRIAHADTASPAMAASLILGGDAGHREFWRLLLLSVLLLMLVETILSNRTVP